MEKACKTSSSLVKDFFKKKISLKHLHCLQKIFFYLYKNSPIIKLKNKLIILFRIKKKNLDSSVLVTNQRKKINPDAIIFVSSFYNSCFLLFFIGKILVCSIKIKYF